MKISFVSLFEELIQPYFEKSILARAKEQSLIELEFINPRVYSKDKHKKVDDYKIGGGAGLLMQVEPLFECLYELRQKNKKAHIIFASPKGKTFKQADAKRLAKKEHLVFVCGRYEGIDERVIEAFGDELLSLGNFILTGGELASLAFCDAICRNIKGVLGNEQSLDEESFEADLLEAPAFAKPLKYSKNNANFYAISEFLKGNHAKINALKMKLASCQTLFSNPSLYARAKTRKKYEK